MVRVLGEKERALCEPVRAPRADWTVTWAEPADATGRALCWPALRLRSAVRRERYSAARDGRIWCVRVEHEEHLIVAQRALRDHRGLVTSQSRPIIVGQSQLARSEAYTISNTDHQYLVPTDGSPLRGLIQDNVLTGVLLTALDTFLSRSAFQQLLLGCVEIDPTLPLPTPRPALLKPVERFTGKQLIGSVLALLTHGRPPLNLVSKAKVAAAHWAQHVEEAVVIVRQNELVTGVLDKSQFGDAAYGLVHAVYELYGANTAGQLLSTLGRLFTLYLQGQAFTCGIDDMLILAQSEERRQNLISDSAVTGVAAACDFAGVGSGSGGSARVDGALQRLLREPGSAARLDAVMKGALNPFTSQIIGACLPSGQLKAFPANGMSLMTLSGAKGSAVNFSQISCLLGQQELEGRRVPLMATGKTLPAFRRYDPAPRAGGYVTDRFLTGIRPAEYFFHCMAGREGLIDTAVKTSRSGYLQRCLIKSLETLCVHYDYTVRDSDGSVVQFHYGEDSVDIGRTAYLTRFAFLTHNWKALLHKLNPPAAIQALDTRAVEAYAAQHSGEAAPDPVLAVFSPGAHLGAVSEAFRDAVSAYVDEDPDRVFTSAAAPHTSAAAAVAAGRVTASKFRALMQLNYLHSLVEPGESVGILAAQSVGEPSTQMTLNSLDWTEPIVLVESARYRTVAIGDWVDALMQGPAVQRVAAEGEMGDTRLLDVSALQLKVPSVDADGRVSLRRVTAVTKHLPVNADGTATLLRVTTRSGRVVTATKAKSFLTRVDGRLVATRGDALALGSRLPVAFALPELPRDDRLDIAASLLTDRRSVHVSSSEPQTERVEGRTVAAEDGGLWKKRCTALSSSRCIRSCARSDALVEAVVDPAPGTRLLLDEVSGFFFGAYATAGGASDARAVVISISDSASRAKLKRFVARLHVHPQLRVDAADWSGAEVRLHSAALSRLMRALCGGGVACDVCVPTFALNAADAFVRGLLDGCLSSDSCALSSAGVQLWSASEELILGLQLLLTRIGVFATTSKTTAQGQDRAALPSPVSHALHVSAGQLPLLLHHVTLTAAHKRTKAVAVASEQTAGGRVLDDKIPGCAPSTISALLPQLRGAEARGDATKGVVERRALWALLRAQGGLRSRERRWLQAPLYFDEVVSIEEVQPSRRFVYDLTVEGTKTFQLRNGLMMYDTFHLAGHGGANVTLGIPRLREIIMTASQRIRTPIMEAPLRSGKATRAEADDIAARLTRLSLPQFLEQATVRESVDCTERGAAYRLYAVRLTFPVMSAEAVQSARLSFADFERAFVEQFCTRLHAAVRKEVKAVSASHAGTPVVVVAGGRKARPNTDGERDDPAHEDGRTGSGTGGSRRGAGEEEDAVTAKERRKRHEDASYDAPDEDDLDVIRAEEKRRDRAERTSDDDADSDGEQQQQQRAGKPREDGDEADQEEKEEGDGEEDGDGESDGRSPSPSSSQWLSLLLSRCPYLRSVSFDPKQTWAEVVVAVSLSLPKLLLMSAVEEVVESVLLRSTPGISRAFVVEKASAGGAKTFSVATDGVAFHALARYAEELDLDRLHSNDVAAILRTYGVEAARAAITREVQAVFAPYGISVDYRHLALIADFMTCGGDYRPLNRGGIDSNPSTFQKVSFETSMHFLKQAALLGDTDHLTSPSSRIVLGQPVHCGTGAFQLMQPISSTAAQQPQHS